MSEDRITEEECIDYRVRVPFSGVLSFRMNGKDKNEALYQALSLSHHLAGEGFIHEDLDSHSFFVDVDKMQATRLTIKIKWTECKEGE